MFGWVHSYPESCFTISVTNGLLYVVSGGRYKSLSPLRRESPTKKEQGKKGSFKEKDSIPLQFDLLIL